MRTHHDTKRYPYTPEQLFDLVADVGSYPEFIPWVKGARITEHTETRFVAELIVRFKGITETYASEVVLNRPKSVDVALVRGPFNHLENHWRFTPTEDGGCEIDFKVAFEFKNIVLDTLIGALFARATEKMIDAFSERAEQLYGTPK
ncbi:MAG: ubiquinone-binding protein [Rickettsiales bacterium]|nr:ubiquinone-binding protein [Rickettsiales bacterium]|tara:strand:- start:849 stop:1289 length:441 start_codon:yes stop_codon:yes gene_type:complete